ncbi:MAG: DOPA 4,5-dioxygenase family protein [Nitrospiria bacterium]
MADITTFHAHVYYDTATFPAARALCEAAGKRFALSVGTMHQRPVGPHPCWSCQLEFTPEVFGEVIPWLMLNRGGLTIFAHANTGDDWKDHTEHTLWMGEQQTLNLSFLKEMLAE